jgi:hypothetical protein
MLKGDKYFELIKVTKPPEIMLAYKNRNSLSTYPIRLVNKDFTLLLTFSSAPILSKLGILPDALLGRQSYNNALITFKTRFLFQLNRNNVAH